MTRDLSHLMIGAAPPEPEAPELGRAAGHYADAGRDGGVRTFDAESGQAVVRNVSRAHVGGPQDITEQAPVGRLTDKDVVVWKGLPMRPLQAAQTGAPIEQHADGKWYPRQGAYGGDGGLPPTHPTQSEQPDTPRQEHFAAFDDLRRELPPPILDSIITKAAGEGLADDDIIHAARAVGMEREGMEAMLGAAISELQQSAIRQMAALGVDADSFAQWVEANPHVKRETHSAMMLFARTRNISAFDKLIQRYGVGRDRATLLAANKPRGR